MIRGIGLGGEGGGGGEKLAIQILKIFCVIFKGGVWLFISEVVQT